MPSAIPEITLTKVNLPELFNALQSKLTNFSIDEILFINVDHSTIKFFNLNDLLAHIDNLQPIERSNATVKFSYLRTAKSTRKTKGALYFHGSNDLSKIHISGGTKLIQTDEKLRILSILSKFKRTLSNKTILIIMTAVPVLAFILNFFISPDTIVSGTAFRTFIAGIIAFPFFVFSLCRPHVFFMFDPRDVLKVFPNFLHILFGIGLWGLLFWSIVKSPTWLGRDSSIVASDPAAQVVVLRNAITPDLLSAVNELKEANRLYDSAESDIQKNTVSRILIEKIEKITNKQSGLGAFPIDKLQYFLSSSRKLQDGNWIGEPLLLGITARDVSGTMLVHFFPRVDTFSQDNKFITLTDWLNEKILKDEYGKTWSRAELVEDLSKEAKGELAISSKNELIRLRDHKVGYMQFQSHTGQVTEVPKTVDKDSVRAISEELVRSMITIQRQLSANPE